MSIVIIVGYPKDQNTREQSSYVQLIWSCDISYNAGHLQLIRDCAIQFCLSVYVCSINKIYVCHQADSYSIVDLVILAIVHTSKSSKSIDGLSIVNHQFLGVPPFLQLWPSISYNW